MTAHRSMGGFWMTNHVINPVLALVLRSPLGRRMGRHLALLAYRGRRSDRRHELVVQYAREGSEVWIVPGQPQRKTWWRNFSTSRSVELRLAGEACNGRAVVLGDDQPEEVRRAIATYLRHLPRAADALGIDEDGARISDPAAAASGTVVVHVELESNGALDLAGPRREPAP